MTCARTTSIPCNSSVPRRLYFLRVHPGITPRLPLVTPIVHTHTGVPPVPTCIPQPPLLPTDRPPPRQIRSQIYTRYIFATTMSKLTRKWFTLGLDPRYYPPAALGIPWIPQACSRPPPKSLPSLE